MLRFSVLFVFTIVCSGVFCTDHKDNYTVDEVLQNDELIKEFTDCLLDKGPCNLKDAKELKEKIPQALEDACEKCDDEQKEDIVKAVGFLIENKPELWIELVEKYDPDEKYHEKFSKSTEP